MLTAGFIFWGSRLLTILQSAGQLLQYQIFLTHQMVASTTSPSSLVSTCWVFPTRGKCTAGSSYWPPPPVLIVVLVAQIPVHRFFTNLRFCAQLGTQLPLVPVSVVPPLPSRLSHSTQPRRPHRARRFARFKVLRRIDRLEHSPSAARHLQIWSLRFV